MSNLSNLIQDLIVKATSQNEAGSHHQANTDRAGGFNSGPGDLINGNLGSVLGNILGGNSANQNQTHNQSRNQSVNPAPQQGGLGGGLGSGLGGVLGSVLGGLGRSNGSVLGGNFNQNRSLGGKSQLLFILLPFILNWVQQQGGFKAVLDKFNQAGMGQQVNSWVSNGDNQPVQASQLASVIPPEQVEQVAQQTNTSTSEVYDNLATLLPQIVNAITPNGQAAGNGSRNQIQEVMNAFRQYTLG